ncbi:MAG: phosphatidylglycerophosphatase A [Candidatus Marinimicrobia bacterium]|nr:phosphatidylglycerophosphatase A [Candidatus Neomarinimicrobiota bacterium]
MKNNKSRWFATSIGSFFGVGFIPVAPGTAASLITVLIAFVLYRYFPMPLIWEIEIFFILLLIGFISARDLIRHRDIKDPAWFVMDEVAGMWLALIGLPKNNLIILISAFICFRVFDIFKPWIIKKAEGLNGAAGIMLDDVLAAVPSWLICFAIWKLFL